MQNILKRNTCLTFAIIFVCFTFFQANHFHSTFLDNSNNVQLSDQTDAHTINTCVLCSVGGHQSFAIAEKKNENVLNDLKSLYLTSDLEVFSYFNLSNPERAPPSFA